MKGDTKKRNIFIKALKFFLTGLMAIMLIMMLIFIVAGLIPEKSLVTPAGYKQYQSLYVTMKDGTKINVKVMLPYDLKESEKVPAIIESTRYGTGYQMSFLGKALMNLGIMEDDMPVIVSQFLKTGHAYIWVQARGSGASFGKRDIDLSAEEIDDYGQMIDWIVKQPWSNGKVGAYGISYMSNTAELTARLKNPALKAAALLYGDFNSAMSCISPGGLLSDNFLKRFRDGNDEVDKNINPSYLTNGLRPADNDKKGKLLKEAVSEHKNYDIYECMKKATYYDDVLSGGYTLLDTASFNFKKDIEESGIPFYVRVGWQDAATVNGAIERFLTYNNSQVLVIGPWNHGGKQFCDPLLVTKYAMQELEKSQADEVIAFLDKYIKDDAADASDGKKEIRYYTLGEGKWKTSDKWPVDGVDNRTFYFDANGSLNEKKPENSSGKDTYKVDYTASTGKNSRWQTNCGAGPIIYPDRAQEDKKLLTYTSEALESDVEITGVPVVTLNFSSTSTDGAFYVYLEDIAPDDRVTYITEGELRALHRKISDEYQGYAVLGPNHSYKRKDGELLKPGENAEMKVGMAATSVLIKKGHRIRIAIACSDADNFDNISESDSPIIEIQRNSILSSYVELPIKER